MTVLYQLTLISIFKHIYFMLQVQFVFEWNNNYSS